MRGKIIYSVAVMWLLTCLCLSAGNLIAVYAIKDNKSLKFRVVNISGKTLFVSDPEKIGAGIDFVGTESEGSFRFVPPQLTKPRWKYLITLTHPREGPANYGHFEFKIPLSTLSPKTIRSLEIELCLAVETEFKRKSIAALRSTAYTVTFVKSFCEIKKINQRKMNK